MALFACGRRPAGHVMMSVVGVVVVVGGEQLLYMGSPRAHVWSHRIQKQNPFFVYFFISKAHVWFKCPCMVCSRRKKKKEEGEGGSLFILNL